MSTQVARARERVPTGRRGRPSKSMIAAALERPFCAYLHKICLNNRLEGHKYCIDHIMNDKTAPYRQCTYVHSVTGRRCQRAAHKVDRRASPLCLYHRSLKINSPHQQHQLQLHQIQQQSQQTPPTTSSLTTTTTSATATETTTTTTTTTSLSTSTPEDIKPQTVTLQNNVNYLTHHKQHLDPQQSLLEDLAHYRRRPDQPNSQNTNTFWLPKGDGSAIPSAKLCKVLAKYNSQRQEPPIELPSIEDIAARHNNADSDTESVDNNYDTFKHASVFTEEELTKILRDKMIKLRRLYIEQYGHTQYILKEKRLKYIQAQRNEDELFGELYSYRNYRDSPDYAKLRAMLRYHKTFGPESLLQEQAKRRKIIPHQSISASTELQESICIYSKTAQGCDKPCIPLSPYCRQHILYDTKQVLFRPCAGGVPPCLTPVVSFTKKNKCWLHTAIN